MNLIAVTPNVLVNPKFISCVEQKKINGKESVIVWIDGRSYALTRPYKDFENDLKNVEISSSGQHWAG